MTARSFGVLLLALAAGCTAVPVGTPRRPNVVVFLVDDLGWRDCSRPFASARDAGTSHFRTPNLERLCREGTRFTQAYAHPVCTPSRVSLLTGIAAARHKVTHWTLRKGTPTDPERNGLRRPAWNVNGLSDDAATPRAFVAPTLADLLRQVGYRTLLVGKAHFGAAGTPGADPKNLGFDANVAGHAAGAPSSYLARNAFLRPGDEAIWQVPGLANYHGQDRFLSDVLTDEALAAIAAGRDSGQPFLLWFAHYAVHAPFDADDRFVQSYRDAGLPEAEARYAALVEGVDHSLGRLLDALAAW
ncbi:MAG: sulfatase-like hydrolase/transferase, partial [Planctomycetes bacterium]|nr:sulfatase-like hydrolase/transferase [Planctomycetota bacterium]